MLEFRQRKFMGGVTPQDYDRWLETQIFSDDKNLEGAA